MCCPAQRHRGVRSWNIGPCLMLLGVCVIGKVSARKSSLLSRQAASTRKDPVANDTKPCGPYKLVKSDGSGAVHLTAALPLKPVVNNVKITVEGDYHALPRISAESQKALRILDHQNVEDEVRWLAQAYDVKLVPFEKSVDLEDNRTLDYYTSLEQ
mmetsp:Transcript_699/g.1223  ORF Transcript_699/g.1223 Transcript_699/m.1223 type:complete len:156 (+) Transcript_699:106-573(+)